jgi:hypothetical protein
MLLGSASTFHNRVEEANFRSKLAPAAATVIIFGVRLPNVEADDDFDARS